MSSSHAQQQQFAMSADGSSSAVISECGLYRYLLARSWGKERPAVFLMLNPSTADAIDNDATIRKCIRYARAWGCGGLVVVNLFALRSTDPDQLLNVNDPVGPKTDSYLRAAVEDSDLVVCAWGAHKAVTPGRVRAVLEIIRATGKQPMHLRLTQDGQPWHPLYLPAKLRPIPFGGT
jgi:hypothetical protein